MGASGIQSNNAETPYGISGIPTNQLRAPYGVSRARWVNILCGFCSAISKNGGKH